jgi:uncharacterized membrane protein YfcA
VVLIVFSVVMVAAGIQMLRRRPGLDPAIETATHAKRVLLTIGIGVGVGFLTGLLGVGGGFVIVPALVFFLEIPMTAAIGTSLVITTVNSLSGLLAHSASSRIDWPVTLLFAGSAIVSALVAARLARRLSNTVLQRSFAVLVFVVAGYTLVRSLLP